MKMLGWEELKKEIKIKETTVECPVKGCNETVKRQRRVFKNEDIYKCPKHNIFISPTTFEYSDPFDNLLWKDTSDKELLKKIDKVKRESRMARDNSEDAVTWNIFRFLEKNKLMNGFLNSIIEKQVKSSQVIYWSYSQEEKGSWSQLDRVREIFGEERGRGSEPDIIIITDKALFFIEAKLTSPSKIDFNKSHSPEEKEDRIQKYSRGDRFLKQKSIFKDIIDNKLYELGRFWVIGCTMAEIQKKDFYLINLVRGSKEKNIEHDFGKYIDSTQRRIFLRLAWENIYHCISKGSLTKDKEIMLHYFRNKAIGYENGKLQRAFSIPDKEHEKVNN